MNDVKRRLETQIQRILKKTPEEQAAYYMHRRGEKRGVKRSEESSELVRRYFEDIGMLRKKEEEN